VYGKLSYYDVNSRTPGGLTVAQYNADPFQNTRPTDFWSGDRKGADVGYLNTHVGHAGIRGQGLLQRKLPPECAGQRRQDAADVAAAQLSKCWASSRATRSVSPAPG
jgi:hypothetical protein